MPNETYSSVIDHVRPVFPRGLRRFITFLRAGFVITFFCLLFGFREALIPFVLTFGGHSVIMIRGMFFPNSQLFGFVFSRGVQTKKVIALTFDDGPSQETTPLILDVLKEHNKVVTFFVIGTKAEENKSLVHRMVSEGHDVENHTWKHPPTQAVFPLYYKEKIKGELNRCTEVIKSITNRAPLFVRFPAGIKSLPLMEAACELGLIVAGFSTRAFDSSAAISKDIIVRRVKKTVFPGAIVVLHDGTKTGQSGNLSATIEALPEILTWLEENSYHCVRLSELFSEVLKTQPVIKGLVHDKT